MGNNPSGQLDFNNKKISLTFSRNGELLSLRGIQVNWLEKNKSITFFHNPGQLLLIALCLFFGFGIVNSDTRIKNTRSKNG